MIAKTTFNIFDTHKIFGVHKSCHCKPMRSPLLSTASTSSTSSSGYSSERSCIEDMPDSPDSTKLVINTPYKNAFLSPVVHQPNHQRAFTYPPVNQAVPQRRGSYSRSQTHGKVSFWEFNVVHELTTRIVERLESDAVSYLDLFLK